MPTVTQLSRLFRLVASGDQSGALAIAREIAKAEDDRGHRGAAQMLRGSLNPNGHAASGFAASPATAVGLYIREPDGPPLEDIVLRPATRTLLMEVVSEWENQALLRREQISRRTSLLFWGPPGCGKTLTARALGRRLGLPVVTARLSSIVGSYLGQTSSNLRELFSYAQAMPCVLLLDEFDALGRSRGRTQDVGELDRVVISLLQELDHSEPAGLIIAATNVEKSLDPALWRRFDASVKFPRPSKRELERFACRRLREGGLSQRTAFLQRAATAASFAEVDSALEDLRRKVALQKAQKKK